jgi:hypothetical protein
VSPLRKLSDEKLSVALQKSVHDSRLPGQQQTLAHRSAVVVGFDPVAAGSAVPSVGALMPSVQASATPELIWRSDAETQSMLHQVDE